MCFFFKNYIYLTNAYKEFGLPFVFCFHIYLFIYLSIYLRRALVAGTRHLHCPVWDLRCIVRDL